MDVEFEGAFTPEEQAFLRSQFSRCRFTLVARSAVDPRVALIYWHGISDRARGGSGPLYKAPARAAYVLQRPDEAAAGGRRAEPALVRVDGDAALQVAYPGHFPGVRLDLPRWEGVRRALRRAVPALMVTIAAIWVLLLVWQLRLLG